MLGFVETPRRLVILEIGEDYLLCSTRDQKVRSASMTEGRAEGKRTSGTNLAASHSVTRCWRGSPVERAPNSTSTSGPTKP